MKPNKLPLSCLSLGEGFLVGELKNVHVVASYFKNMADQTQLK